MNVIYAYLIYIIYTKNKTHEYAVMNRSNSFTSANNNTIYYFVNFIRKMIIC